MAIHLDELDDVNIEIDSLTLEELCDIFSSLSGYTQSPVSIDEFLDSPEFLGPFFDGGLYPHWRKVLREIYPNPHFSPYWLCVFRGAIGCVREDTLIDTIDGRIAVGDIQRPTHYKTWDGSKFSYGIGSAPFRRGKGDLYRVVHEQGVFVAFESHLVLCLDGRYRPVRELAVGDLLLGSQCSQNPPATTREPAQRSLLLNGEHSTRTGEGCLGDCSTCSHRYDQPPLLGADSVRSSSPSQGDVRGSAHASSPVGLAHAGVQEEREREYIRRGQRCGHPSMRDSALQSAHQRSLAEGRVAESSFAPSSDSFVGSAAQSQMSSFCRHKANEVNRGLPQSKNFDNHTSSYVLLGSKSDTTSTKVLSIEYAGNDWYWDLQVPNTNNYVAEGCVHHNCGKTSISCAGLAYDLYKLLCMKNPQKHYNLVSSTKIVFALINRTLTLSGDVVWDKLSQIFVQSSFFSKIMGCVSDGKISRRKAKRDTLFPHRIDFIVGSRSGHALGQAVFGAAISEANFQVVEDQMYDTFNSLIRRMESRFMTAGGGIPGHIWLDSSESDKFSVVNRIVDSWKKSNGVYMSQAPIWNVKGHLLDSTGKPIYSGQRFWVFCGSETRRPEIVDPSNEKLLDLFPEACIHVPVEHRDAFEADINEAIRDLGGRATVSSSKLFRLRDRLVAAMNVPPLFPDSIQLDFDDDADQIFNYAPNPRYFADPLNAHVPRYLHIDIGISGDRLGIAASYVAGFRDSKFRDPVTFEETIDNVPVLATEWCFGVEPKPGKQVPLFKIRLFIQWLSQQGYPIAEITFDGFQSADSLQGLKHMGFATDLLSVDRTVTPYVCLRTLVYEGRASLPNNAILKRELEELEMNATGDKVDHLKGETKDLADSVAGSVFNANKNAGKARLFHAIPGGEKSQGQQIASMFWNQD